MLRGLRRTCLFQKVSPEELAMLATVAERVVFKEGDQIGSRQGEPQQALFVVTEGHVCREHSMPDGRRIRRVNEGSSGMGDAWSYSVESRVAEGGRAEIIVEGPDVDGLLSSMARALFSAGVNIVSANAESPVGENGQARARTKFVVERRNSLASVSSSDGALVVKRREVGVDATTAKVLGNVVKEACDATTLGFLRQEGKVNSFGTLHAVGRVPAFATTRATTDGVAWRLSAETVEQRLKLGGDFSVGVATGLCAEVFRMSESYNPTPLFDQPPRQIDVAAVSVAAAFEAYYRAMLNSLLNSSLSGKSSATLFPNMHVQIPTRVAYINGFKFLRLFFSEHIDMASTYGKLIPALLPGVVMTPVSSLLEACNAGHANPEPLLWRSTRGTLPRCAREVIFGLGLNHVSEYCEDLVPNTIATSKLLRNALGSVAAGVLAGYVSHVPHNLSTLKMLEPHVSYADHWQRLVHIARTTRLPPALPPRSGLVLANLLTLFLPAGLAIRTTQIVGSFCLLNGITNALDRG